MTSFVVLISGQFSKKLANLNVDNILKNDRILTNYVKCMLDKGKSDTASSSLRLLNMLSLHPFKVHAPTKVAS